MSGANSLDLDKIFEGKDAMGEEIGNLWMAWNSARTKVLDRWNETTQFVYATSTRETVGGSVGGFEEDGRGWSHSTHVPKITQIADNLSANYMSAVLPNDDWFRYIGQDSESVKQEIRRKVEAYLKAKHRNTHLRTIVQRLVDDYVLYGNCFATVYFEEETVQAEIGEETYRSGYVGPRVQRISPFDIVFNPLATDFEHSPKIIRSLKTLGELHRDVEENPGLGYDRDVLQKIIDLRGELSQVNHEDFNKHTQLSFDGFSSPSQYFQSGHVEILDFYGDIYDIHNNKFYKNHVITVVDKKFVIRNEPLKTWSGRPLIFHAGWRTRPDNIWAMGPLDNLIGMQYLINHLENARADAFDQMLAPTRVIIGDVEEYEVEAGKPGGEFRIPSGEGDVKNLAPDTTVLAADLQIERKENQMEDYAGAPRQEMGIRTPGEKTLGEVQHLHQASTKIFKNKIIQFESFLERLLNAEIEVARSYPNLEDIVAVLGEDGVTEFMNITRDDLKSNGKLVPIGARHFERKAQALSNFQLMQQALMQDPLALEHFSSIKLAKMYEELMDLDVQGVVSPFVRVGEKTKLQQYMNAAETQLAVQDQADMEEEEVV